MENDVYHVLSVVEDVTGAVVTSTGGGRYGYQDGYQAGPVKVYVHPERSDMGVMVDVDGEGCEVLGWAKLAEVHDSLGLRASRLDLAVDGAAFTPATLRDAWRAGDVRTRVKVGPTARPDRQWRKSHWQEFDDGDLFTMGSRRSTQYMRCYDRRGFTRLELELKDRAAELAADEVMRMVGLDDSGVPVRVIAWMRRFVDFVSADSDENASRRTLLPWWSEFTGAAEKAHVRLGCGDARTVAEVRDWFEEQMAATLAVLSQAYGAPEVMRLVRNGRKRWRAKHRVLLASAPPSSVSCRAKALPTEGRSDSGTGIPLW